MIKPTNPAAVQIPDSSNMGNSSMMRPGYPQQNMMQQQATTMSGGDVIKNFLTQSLAAGQQTGGGFNWGGVGSSLYEDEGLRALKVKQENDPESNAYMIERVASAMQTFWNQLYHRAGPLYEESRKARENFRFNEMNQADEVLNAFIEDVNKQHDFARIIAVNGMPFFGRGLIELLRNGNRDQLQPAEYLNMTYNATRNILFFELVNWLMRSPNGRRYVGRLSKSVGAKIANLEGFKEAAAGIFDFFNQTSPYNNLEFKIPENTRPDFGMLYGPATDYVQRSFEPVHVAGTRTPAPPSHELQDIMQMVNRNATSAGQYQANINYEERREDAVMQSWDNVRTDLNNLNPRNRAEFQLGRFFHPIGKPKHYFIPESDWKKIKGAYKKHEDMGVEETVLPGCFRIVIIDLELDDGWWSTIVRNEGLEMTTVLSDPSKLLPELENPSDLDDSWIIKPIGVEDITVGKTMDVSLETVQKLEKDTPLIVVKDPVISRNSKEIESTMDVINNRLTQRFTKENAVGFHVTAWDTYTCESADEKFALHNDLTFLFKDNDSICSFSNAVAAVSRYALTNSVSDGLIKFIGDHLTQVINNWLINAAGYDARPNAPKGSHLSVGNILDDYQDLLAYLKKHDPETGIQLVQNDTETYLTKSVQMFDYENPFKRKDGEEISVVDQLKEELELVVQRPICVTMINKRSGPIYMTANEPIVIRRSKFPDYFKLVEEGFTETMGEQHDVLVTDKVLRFSDSNNMWLFTYSNIDRNTASLRFVPHGKALCLMPLA